VAKMHTPNNQQSCDQYEGIFNAQQCAKSVTYMANRFPFITQYNVIVHMSAVP